MKLGRIEILLIILVVCGGLFMLVQYLPKGGMPQVCGPVPLSPEVKAYIDQKIAAGATASQTGEVPAVVSRVNDLETKLASLDRYKELRDSLATKRESLENVVEEQRRVQTDVLAQLRNAELGRLRNEMAMMCSGLSVRSSGSTFGPKAGTPAPRGGRGGGGGGGGGGGRRRQQGAQPGGAEAGGGAAVAPAVQGGAVAPAGDVSGAQGGTGGGKN